MQRLTASPDFAIHSLTTPEEIEAYFLLNAQVFRADEDTALVASRRSRLVRRDPDARAIQQRGAFLGKTYVGGYRIQERRLCLGPARLHTGCVGGVVTHPEYRQQGIATAMMWDALTFARSQQYALLLLHGIPDFYSRFGFVDVLEDMPWHALSRSHIPAPFPTGYTVRAATVDDVPDLLALYQQHYGGYGVSFAPTRGVERQAHYLQNWFQENIPLLALNAEDRPEGYLFLSRRRHKLYAYEVAANTWPAIVALLHHHSRLLDAEAEPPAELRWPLPPTDIAFYLLADHFPLHSEIHSYPDRGWMARPVSLPILVQSLLPLWQERWQRGCLEWTGVVTLTVGEYTCFLELRPQGVRLMERPSIGPQPVRFSEQVFTQLLFGFRPVAWAGMQPEQHIPVELMSVLNVLFPARPAWIPGSDMF